MIVGWRMGVGLQGRMVWLIDKYWDSVCDYTIIAAGCIHKKEPRWELAKLRKSSAMCRRRRAWLESKAPLADMTRMHLKAMFVVMTPHRGVPEGAEERRSYGGKWSCSMTWWSIMSSQSIWETMSTFCGITGQIGLCERHCLACSPSTTRRSIFGRKFFLTLTQNLAAFCYHYRSFASVAWIWKKLGQNALRLCGDPSSPCHLWNPLPKFVQCRSFGVLRAIKTGAFRAICVLEEA